MSIRKQPSRFALSATVLAAALLASACAPLVVGGAMVGGALVATDRRTSGMQLEDESIEIKVGQNMRHHLPDRAHVNANSYNRMVLLTGEVATEADKAKAEAVTAKVENVRGVMNELEVGFTSSLTSRASDSLLATKVKGRLVEAKDLLANAFYVVTERGNVYLLGRVTEREANRAAEIARAVGGVKKVVKMFELISEEELARMTPKAAAEDKSGAN
ncbi:BON domain-containing protein [Pelomonas sp. SE-A7]|uniref:BON domain-containing protein n=1 Tax=Pelomonas sp. SE-A7 TaxID=3054953 RepID=UPI00259CBB8A|nr:BON domain-containing protein [Pelomonas sp. SE-A7]MDM4766456.1 BON domain-containing protein [Pelomonas sp. SE-A7]